MYDYTAMPFIAAAVPVENYKPLETDHDVESEFKDEINGNNINNII